VDGDILLLGFICWRCIDGSKEGGKGRKVSYDRGSIDRSIDLLLFVSSPTHAYRYDDHDDDEDEFRYLLYSIDIEIGCCSFLNHRLLGS